jgi:polyphosphate glucokinase
VVPAIVRTVRRAIRGAAIAASVEIPADAPVGVGVPCVVIDGVTKTAANIDAGWIDFDARAAIEAAIKRPTLVLNDADAAGLAEMRFGAGLGEKGVVFVLTVGTGVGLFNYGVPVPNTELGHMEIPAGTRSDARRRRPGCDADCRKAWATDLEEHLQATTSCSR